MGTGRLIHPNVETDDNGSCAEYTRLNPKLLPSLAA